MLSLRPALFTAALASECTACPLHERLTLLVRVHAVAVAACLMAASCSYERQALFVRVRVEKRYDQSRL